MSYEERERLLFMLWIAGLAAVCTSLVLDRIDEAERHLCLHLRAPQARPEPADDGAPVEETAEPPARPLRRRKRPTPASA